MKNNNSKILIITIIGIIVLIAVVVGATFAYFSASATPDTTTIKGNSNDTISGALSLSVTRLSLGGTANSDNLVPADFGVAANAMTTATINKALTAKCVKNGYTGCHVWKISATTTQAVSAANIKLSLTATKASGNSSGTLEPWSYVVYTGTDSSATGVVSGAQGSFATPVVDKDIHAGASLSATTKVYYLMVYIKNASTQQNSGTNDTRGSYSGTVAFETAGGGQVMTTFN